MNIAELTYYYLPIINGVTLTIDDWKKQAEGSGNSCTIFTSSLGPQLSRDPGVVEFPALSLHRKLGITIPLMPEIFLETEMRKRNIEIIHVHHPSVIGNLAIHLGKRLKIPVVFTYHSRYSDYVKLYFPSMPTWMVNSIVNRYLVHFMNRCQAVTVSLPYLKRELIRKGVKVPVYVVPIGIDTKRFASGDRAMARKELGLNKDDILILGVGRIMREKNWDFLLRAYRLVIRNYKNVKLCIVGKGTYFSKLLRLAVRLKITKSFTIVTAAQYSKIQDYYAAGDIYASTSLTETLGRIYLEAMAAGLPVVSLTTPNTRDLITNNVDGILVKSRMVKTLRFALEDLIKNPDKRKSLGGAAQIKAKKFFDVGYSWSILFKTYKDVLGHFS